MIFKKTGQAKGQGGLEILIVITAVIAAILLLQIFLITPTTLRAQEKMTIFAAEELCEEIASSINLVSYSGSGFFSNFTIPKMLDAKTPYNATIYADEVLIDWHPLGGSSGKRACHFTAKRIVLKLEPPKEVKFAYLLKERCMYNHMVNLGAEVYCNQKFSGDCPEIEGVPCASMSEAERKVSHLAFIQNMSQYDLLVVEDPHFKDKDFTKGHWAALEAQVYENGSYLFVSEHLENSPVFGEFGYKKACDEEEGEGDLVIIKEDPLLGFHLDDTFDLHETPVICGENLTVLGEYDENYAAGISTLTYGEGAVYYFSDFDAEMIEAFGDLSFRDRVVESINKTLQELARYQKPPFVLNNTYYNTENEENDIILTGWD